MYWMNSFDGFHFNDQLAIGQQVYTLGADEASAITNRHRLLNFHGHSLGLEFHPARTLVDRLTETGSELAMNQQAAANDTPREVFESLRHIRGNASKCHGFVTFVSS